MKNLFFVFITLLSFAAITSCQPEVDPLLPQRVDSTGDRLAKVDCRNGADTMSIIFSYDAQKRWIESKIYTIVDDDSVMITMNIILDASGYITKCISIDSSDPANRFTETQNIFHNAVSGRYTHSIFSSSQSGVIADTTYFQYNSQERIVASYLKYSGQLPDTAIYKYKGADLDTATGLSSTVPVTSFFLQYDTRMSPLAFANEAIVLEVPYFYMQPM